ncbi:MAG: hypothetical protein WBM02_07210 [bacterium]
MKWQRLVWVATIIMLWLISLMIVDSAARNTRMGYQQQELRLDLQEQEESNLRLQCEASILHDLEKTKDYADSHNMITSDRNTIEYFSVEITK